MLSPTKPLDEIQPNMVCKLLTRMGCATSFLWPRPWGPGEGSKGQISFNFSYKVSKGAKIRNRYNQVPHLTQDTNGKVTNSHTDTTNESQEINPFPAGDHKGHINRRTQRHSKNKTEKHKRSTTEVPPWNGQ